jgi:hypothetical protein
VFVKFISKSGDTIKVQMVGTNVETAIKGLDSRDDAWMYCVSGAPIPVQVRVVTDEGPRFSPRMIQEGWEGKVFPFDEAELYTSQKEGDDYFGVTLLRHKGDTLKPDTQQPYVNNFRMNWVFPAEAPEWRIPRAERMGIGAVELPLPKKPVPPEHQEVIDMLLDQLKEVKALHTSSNVSFARVSADGKHVESSFNQACHADLQSDVDDFEIGYVLTIGTNTCKNPGQWVKGHPCKEAQVAWVTYLTSHSPYADVFITKDPEFILEHGYIIDASKPTKLVVGACYATRQEWEKPFRAEAFLELMKAGIMPDPAFVFGCQCSQYGNGKIKFAITTDGHNHFQNKEVSDKCIQNFINKTPQYKGRAYSVNVNASRGYGGVDGMWSDKYGEGSDVYKALAAIKHPTANPSANALPVDEAIEQAADIIEDWCGRFGVQANP